MAGIVKTSDLNKVQNVEFVTRFAENINQLLTVLGIVEPIKQHAGQQLKLYKTSGTLEDGNVAEGADIPKSKYQNEVVAIAELGIKKWSKATTLEAIHLRGYEQAVTDTDNKMLRDIQGGVLADFFDVMSNGTGTVSGSGLQQGLARARGELRKKFKNTVFTPVYFVSTDDITEYLAAAQISTQTAFGMTYIENFLNLGLVIEDPTLEKGVFYATACENINLYFIDPTEEGNRFEFYTDETGLVGVKHTEADKNMTYETYAVSGLRFFPEYADRIVVGSIESNPFDGPAVTAASGSAEYWGHTVSDLQEDIAIANGKITGTLKYVDSGTLAHDWGAGNFIALKFTADADDTAATEYWVGLRPTQGSGLVKLDADMDGVFKVTSTDQVFVVVTKGNGRRSEQVYDLSGLVLESE